MTPGTRNSGSQAQKPGDPNRRTADSSDYVEPHKDKDDQHPDSGSPHESEPADPPAEEIDHRDRRSTRLADDPADVAAKVLKECNCGSHTMMGDPLSPTGATVYAADVCEEPRPMTVEGAADVYLAYKGSRYLDDDKPCKPLIRDSKQRGRVLDADRAMCGRYDSPTTVLMTLRQSPTQDGDWVEPLVLDEMIHDSMNAVLRRLRRHELAGYDWEYVRVTAGTRTAATPHIHLYLWVDDPDDEVRTETFVPALERHIEVCDQARLEDHPFTPSGDEGAIRWDRDPLLYPFDDSTAGLTFDSLAASARAADAVPASEVSTIEDADAVCDVETTVSENHQTAGAAYVANQLPHFVLRNIYDGASDIDQDDPLVDAAAIKWASPRDWFSTSRGI